MKLEAIRAFCARVCGSCLSTAASSAPQVRSTILKPHPHSSLLPRSDTKIFPHFLWKNPGRSVYGYSRGTHLCTVCLGHLETQELECVGIWSTWYLPTSTPKEFPYLFKTVISVGSCFCKQPLTVCICIHLHPQTTLSHPLGFGRVRQAHKDIPDFE